MKGGSCAEPLQIPSALQLHFMEWPLTGSPTSPPPSVSTECPNQECFALVKTKQNGLQGLDVAAWGGSGTPAQEFGQRSFWYLLAAACWDKQPKELGLAFSSHELGTIIKTHLERGNIYAMERMFLVLMVSVFFNESLMNPFFSSFSLGGSSLGCSLIAASFAFLAVL